MDDKRIDELQARLDRLNADGRRWNRIYDQSRDGSQTKRDATDVLRNIGDERLKVEAQLAELIP